METYTKPNCPGCGRTHTHVRGLVELFKSIQVQGMNMSDNQRRLTDLMLELEDKGMVRFTDYPSAVARYLLEHEVTMIAEHVWQPTHSWFIYERIAKGFSWKGRRR